MTPFVRQHFPSTWNYFLRVTYKMNARFSPVICKGKMASMHYSLFIFTLLTIVAVSHARILDRDKNKDKDKAEDKDKPDPDLMFCANLAIGINQCLALYDFPYCNGTKSQLEQCTDKYVSDLPKCKVPLITQALTYRAEIYSSSDDVLCKDQFYKKFETNKDCWRLAKTEMGAFAGLVKGLLTDDGCKVAKINVDIIIGLGYYYPGCPALLKSYFEPIFKKTACA